MSQPTDSIFFFCVDFFHEKNTPWRSAPYLKPGKGAFFCFLFFLVKTVSFYIGIQAVLFQGGIRIYRSFFLGIRGRNFEGWQDVGNILWKGWVYSGINWHSNGKWTRIEDVSPIKDGKFPPGHVSLLEGISYLKMMCGWLTWKSPDSPEILNKAMNSNRLATQCWAAASSQIHDLFLGHLQQVAATKTLESGCEISVSQSLHHSVWMEIYQK